ncbi:MAG TPA: DNA adenine methylase [Spirochaetota bacterium]|jgi:DNA adenine methylase|nr:MAG: Modification methylase DpnIIA [Spirochaetes bacterium ADurb.Bin133]HNZ26597.1 DNA adenine methylase [Spirochaetota bacterium]HPY87600.1 DNA adenine methylase [Spirochaetota bacterium]HQB61620.1 DNA adenine methylase [Spirochaetota bacterium]
MNLKPFLKWAGGKTQLLNEIKKLVPFTTSDSFSYIEPFVGSGAALFWILDNFKNIKGAVINDINTDLINCYKIIKEDINSLINILAEYESEYNNLAHESEERKSLYYKNRDLFNKRCLTNVEQSALFIFLNRTCYNGLYRVNRKNEFNVPQGSYRNPQICNRENLIAVSDALKNVEILNGDYTETIKYADEKSFFYFDPPYKPLSATSSFNSYSKDVFNDDEQIRLKLFCDKLDSLGIKWLLSNSDVKGKDPKNNFFDNLFASYNINRVFATRNINSDSEKRGKLTELLITNNKGYANVV